jgi:hypothetical protein
LSQALAAHICNPSYSKDREQEDYCSKPAQANSLREAYLEKTHYKNRAGGVSQSEGPEFNFQYHTHTHTHTHTQRKFNILDFIKYKCFSLKKAMLRK